MDTQAESNNEPQMSMAEEATKLMEESAAELAAGNEPAPAKAADPVPAETPAPDAEVPAQEAPETPAQTEEAPAADPDKGQQPEDTPANTENDLLAGLKSLNNEEREALAKLPAEAQAPVVDFIKRREADMERGFQKKTMDIADLRRDYQPLQDMFKPHMDQLRQMGATPFTYIKRLTDLDQMASNNPDGYVDFILDNLNIDKTKLIERLGGKTKSDEPDDFWGVDAPAAPQAPAPAQQPQATPQPAPQQPQQQMSFANTANQVDNPALAQVQEFQNAMENGVLKHPHFNMVRQDMAALANVYPGDDLSELYRKACLGRSLIAEAPPSLPAAQGDEFEAARKAAARAQTASSVASSEPAAPTAPNFDDMSSAEIFEHFAQGGR
ncbi:hypothetical protein MHM86_02830 [Thalassobius sp. Cn5-15]|nr:hypothetical protein [Thalassobius sp. Cn5-15]